jgi:N-terminal domain of oxidoreductase
VGLASYATHNAGVAHFLRGRCIKNSHREETMTNGVNRQVLLMEKPAGKLASEHFKMRDGTIPEPRDGEALLRVRYISLDAANRAWMLGATYRAALEANTVMAGGGIAEVISSKASELTEGDIVFGDTRPAILGRRRHAQGPGRHDRGAREHTEGADRIARRRQPRQADDQAVRHRRAARTFFCWCS